MSDSSTRIFYDDRGEQPRSDFLGIEEVVVTRLKDRQETVATAESCTGGLLAHRLTNVAGASAVFKEGVVTYSNESKIKLLQLSPSLLSQYGAVSKEVAAAMANAVRVLSGATFGLATTGVAGPTGGSQETPVGTLFLAIAQKGKETSVWKEFFPDGRTYLKEKGSEAILQRLCSLLS